ncbi:MULTISPECIES: AraC family transcriptional regulator [unclassified Janthinobacterium]|uniref:AraC family transcriptional regulator n=1 Tax=unclassified Janthinobacterium TaxID=2610881 RepID=UPI0027136BAC|nr:MULTISPECIES: AraC family transcriptional regulator [unclassified Janthinobacterium]MDO8065812.1 AraC family transcriptional regulator [Janthinobacterium sp. SUN206]MED5613486.1 AraC family transcriptional regulator [Janthinobacterium sp. P210005]
MSSTPHPAIDLSFRSYAEIGAPNRHDFVQLVLPLHGQLLLDIDGKQGKVDAQQGVVIPAKTWHAQHSRVANHSIILDVDAAAVEQGSWGRLLERPYAALGPGARKLIEYLGIMAGQQALTPAVIQGWTPLLLDTLLQTAPQVRSRLAALLARVQAEPGLPWSTASMARFANLSVSRLHALFREEMDTSPHAWLQQQRIGRACDLLTASDASIAEIALAAGFSEQSALTRAMRDSIDATPAAYRRQRRENRSKTQ